MTGGRLRPRSAGDRDGGLLARLRCSGEQRVVGLGRRRWAQAAQTLSAQPVFHTLWGRFTTSLWMMSTPLRLGGPGRGRDGALAPRVGDAPGICQPGRRWPCRRLRPALRAAPRGALPTPLLARELGSRVRGGPRCGRASQPGAQRGPTGRPGAPPAALVPTNLPDPVENPQCLGLAGLDWRSLT